MAENPDASVIIVNHNAGAHLARCVAALRAQESTNFEAIIVDNGSSDDSLAHARTEIGDDPRFLVLEGGNVGFAAGNNEGARHATAPLIATLNPDAFPEPDWLTNLLDAATRHPDVPMFGSTQLDAQDPECIDGAGDRYFAAGIPWREQSTRRLEAGQPVYETFAPCAAAALYRADAFRAVDGFDESFFCFVEDVDLAFRLRRNGGRCLQVTDARVHHIGGGAGGGRSDFARYHGTRNLIWCFFKNMPAPGLLLMPFHLIVLTVLAAKALVRGHAGPTLRGIRDGLGGAGTALRHRRQAPAARGAWRNIMGAMDWSPLPYLTRRQR